MDSLRRTALTLLLLSATLLLSTPSAAVNEYLPLELGYWWEYEFPSGREVWVVDRVVDMDREYLVHAVVASGTTPNAGLENYWENGTSARHDDAKLYGFYDTVKDSGLIYDKPVRMARKNLNLGDHWRDDTDVYQMPGNVFLGEWRFEFVVDDTGTIDVPAGSFVSSSVTVTVTRPGDAAPRPFDPTGRVSGAGSARSGKTWWSRDIGEISFQVGTETARLRSYDVTNPVEDTSWGRVKALFR